MSVVIEPVNLSRAFSPSRSQMEAEAQRKHEPRTDECLSALMAWKIEQQAFRPLDVNKPQFQHLRTPARGYVSLHTPTNRMQNSAPSTAEDLAGGTL
jgi:hypothetical protein